jgi:hypothetical protein
MSVDVRTLPYPHTTSIYALPASEAGRTLDWMRSEAPWRLKVASFYEQWELPIDSKILPPNLHHLSEPAFVELLVEKLLRPITSKALTLVEITAHKLVIGQTIRIHNDFIEGGETHRLLIQFNTGWQDEQGGMLLLFGSASSKDVRRILRPVHGSGLAFEISPSSFHGVSTIHKGERFTLVYSFKAHSSATPTDATR